MNETLKAIESLSKEFKEEQKKLMSLVENLNSSFSKMEQDIKKISEKAESRDIESKLKFEKLDSSIGKLDNSIDSSNIIHCRI